MTVKVDIRVPVGLPIPETAAFIAECEAAGFHGVGVHDHQHSGRDVYVTLTAAALGTSRIELYPATTNPVTRYPSVSAAVAQSLEEIAPGRVMLTIGPGYLAVVNIGHRKARVAEVREAILTMQRLLRGETVEINGARTRMRNISPRPTPIYMTAAGPRMMELAGEVADGVMMMVGLHPDSVAAARKLLRAGAERAGRDLSGFEEIFITPMTVDPDGRAARRWPQQWFRPGEQPYLKYPSEANLRWLREAGIDLPDDIVPEQVDDALAERICDAFGLFGTAEECLARLERAEAEAGVKRVFIFPTHTQEGGYEMPRRELAAFRDVIFPGMRG